ncbi:glutathione S-transferase C-terminal domain-containing protein [Rhodobacter sp. KR11]|jgi:putative glutathione S-transferase|uniref:glutathione S-transferase family protein n=1 Tax=Rhodobacter sp. KR11 TaxID=2974588 RepID=UPI0022228077|nr:glutathione S-transferase C-terminal domain-containing protein [Rhodobacter sp. KR11]MCW1917283.1 glutathione S-transferase C-terminal domain-containing protein [Rhodobacter sp. KR11]
MLIDGKWTQDWQPVQAKDEKGGFVRQVSSFRHRLGGAFPAEAGRYHLYVALICPWASRTLMARKLKGLEDVITVSVVEPALTAQGWEFATPDPLTGAKYMHQVYTKADPHVSGRATVPVLWDKVTGQIVNNESADILRIFNEDFGGLASGPDLYPLALRGEIDALNEVVYPGLNNGVYRAGFATTQEAYDEAVALVFDTLTALEARMSDGRTWLMGEIFTEADIRAFVTAVRFDVAYHGIFKCNLRRFADHARLQAWMERVLALPGVAQTVSLDHIKRGYYSIKTLNPNGIIPRGPDLAWARGLA